MEIKNLKEGQVIKNYKELCNILNEKIKGGSSKRCQLIDWKRYFDWHKDKNKFIIDKIYDTPKDKINNRRWNNFKNFDNLKINKNQYNQIGVYKIVQENKIYIGSTVAGFRKRFLQHRANSNDTITRDMLSNGGYFEIIWVAPENSTEPEIREKEDSYIKYYKNNEDWICMNEHDAWSLLCKPKIKYKNIKIDKKDYNRALEILLNNDINFK